MVDIATFGNPQNRQLKKAWEEFQGIKSSINRVPRLGIPDDSTQYLNPSHIVRQINDTNERNQLLKTVGDDVIRRTGRETGVDRNVMDAINKSDNMFNSVVNKYRGSDTNLLNQTGRDIYETPRYDIDSRQYVAFPHGGMGEEPIPSNLLNTRRLNAHINIASDPGHPYNMLTRHRLYDQLTDIRTTKRQTRTPVIDDLLSSNDGAI